MTNFIQQQKEAGKEFLQKNKEQDGVTELDNGIQYQVVQEGTGKTPLVTDTILAHYKGSLLNGKEFDSSYKRGKPFSAPILALIKGWQVAIPMMKEGSIWRLWIPSDLAYGDRGSGSIPGGATLLFEVELISIVNK
ncbi:MAG: FKBP-type peptidyl-prolyl cis-trans isomerase [Bacteroidetes bacterium]|nr:FKBP-type peptidyl-prolyl cis-trans isomerase [Bacteroidota bacterium]